MNRQLVNNPPIQRTIHISSASLSPERFEVPASRAIYQIMCESSVDFYFPDNNTAFQAIINFAELATAKHWNNEEIKKRLEHNELLAKSMENLTSQTNTYSNRQATDLAGKPYNDATAETDFDSLFTRNKRSVNKWVSGKHITGRVHAYNCWSAVVKAAYDAQIISAKKAVFACTRNDGILRLMEHAVKLIDYDKDENDAETRQLLLALPRGTILSFGPDDERSNHVFLCTGPDRFAEVSHLDTDDIIRSDADFLKILEQFPGRQIIWYTFIDDLDDPPPPEITEEAIQEEDEQETAEITPE